MLNINVDFLEFANVREDECYHVNNSSTCQYSIINDLLKRN